jgi:hypothetical protein
LLICCYWTWYCFFCGDNEAPGWTQLKLPGQSPSARCGHSVTSGGPYVCNLKPWCLFFLNALVFNGWYIWCVHHIFGMLTLLDLAVRLDINHECPLICMLFAIMPSQWSLVSCKYEYNDFQGCFCQIYIFLTCFIFWEKSFAKICILHIPSGS